jgi:hypothetical protein
MTWCWEVLKSCSHRRLFNLHAGTDASAVDGLGMRIAGFCSLRDHQSPAFIFKRLYARLELPLKVVACAWEKSVQCRKEESSGNLRSTRSA